MQAVGSLGVGAAWLPGQASWLCFWSPASLLGLQAAPAVASPRADGVLPVAEPTGAWALLRV